MIFFSQNKINVKNYMTVPLNNWIDFPNWGKTWEKSSEIFFINYDNINIQFGNNMINSLSKIIFSITPNPYFLVNTVSDWILNQIQVFFLIWFSLYRKELPVIRESINL